MHELKGDLDWIVMKCLEKDRQRRYDTANGLAADLKRHLANEPVTARPPSTACKFQKAYRRNKGVFAAGAAVAVALVFGIIVSAWQAVRATRAEAEAIAESLERLVQLYDAWGKPAPAAEWKQKLAAFQQANKTAGKKGAQP